MSILGTDINRQYLTIAREGRYEEWSLRATSNELRRACFEQEGKRWTIAPEYKTGVSFQFHNLVENPFPPQLDDLSAFDLIICRNVMIYFGSELMQRLVRQFHDCLAPGSWLLVGPSEPNMTCFTAFRPVNAPGVTLYQKPAGPATNVAETFTFPSLRLPVVPLEQIAEAPPAIPSKDATVPTLDDLRQRANQGDWENAARCGRELIESDNLNALVHFHYALVLEHMGDTAESERSLRRAIYLDRQAVLTHYHLGRLLRSRGDGRQATRYFENALNLLESLPGEVVLTDADGITVAELRKLAQMQVESLKQQV